MHAQHFAINQRLHPKISLSLPRVCNKINCDSLCSNHGTMPTVPDTTPIGFAIQAIQG